MEVYQTSRISEDLGRCDDIEQLKNEILPLLQNQRTAWASKIAQIMTARNLSTKQMAQLCGVSEPAVRKWRKGSLPQTRDMYLRIGFAAGFDLAEMNQFLKRYGKCPQLYVKSLEDSICIFVLQSNLEHSYRTYSMVLKLIRQELLTGASNARQACQTAVLSEQISGIRSMAEMIAFAKSNAPSYKQAYERLYRYINAFLMINLSSEYFDDRDGRKASFHAMATESQWSSSLRHCISEIRQKKWFPLRHKIISLGLHLNMDTDSINEMLRYAQMEPLYAKNPVEASVIWAINEAKLSSETDEIIQDGSTFLCDFVKDILEQLDLTEESSYLIDDL